MADSLLQEIDEALRADRASAWWHKNRRSVIAFAAALVLGTAANVVWQNHREAKGGETLLALSEAQHLLDAGKAKEAALAFGAIAEKSGGDAQALARVWQARAHLAANDKDSAIKALKLAADGGHGLWADIACLRLAGLDAPGAATCLNANARSPLGATRDEWAAANLWVEGKTDEAIARIERLIASPETSTETRARLQQWLVGIEAQKTGK